MAAWIPILKASLPYLSQIVSAAIPAFTAKSATDKADLITRQIGELQSAVTRNAESVQTLATQLHGTLATIDANAVRLQQEVRVVKVVAAVAVVLSLCSTVVTGMVLLANK